MKLRYGTASKNLAMTNEAITTGASPMPFHTSTQYRYVITSDEEMQPWHALYLATNGYRKHGSLWVGRTLSLPAEPLRSIWHIPREGGQGKHGAGGGGVANTGMS